MAYTKKTIGLIIVIILLFISIIINIQLYKYTFDTLRQLKKIKIDPTSSLQYPESYIGSNKEKNSMARIVLFGDSRICMWKKFPHISGCEVVNRGISNETTAMSLLRLQRDIVSLNPAMAVIELGVNDCNSIGMMPDLKNYITSNCKNNIEEIINILQRNRIRVVFLTIFPVATVYPCRWPIWSEETRDAIEEINTFILRYKNPYVQVLNCDAIFLENGKMKHKYADDMLHLNEQGYRALNAYIKPHLVKMIKNFTVKE